ncbi:protein of unknown function [Nitrospira japonica]|uniref:Uncharacterized protein n=1 Tax=Nitrospira japonica TaxID=1325564 RepID=A0A1W1I4X3_9BACT|nr:protein of unknown function [Nitrospira japonica]
MVGKPFECLHYNMIRSDAGLGQKKNLFRPLLNRDDWLTSFSTLGHNAPHVVVVCNAAPVRFCSRSLRASRSPMHLVQDFDEETARGRRTIRSLHLPKVHLSTHHPVGAETPSIAKTLVHDAEASGPAHPSTHRTVGTVVSALCGRVSDARMPLECDSPPVSSTSPDRSGTTLSPESGPSHP